MLLLLLQVSLAAPDLWQEAALLRRLIYKNSSQHRSSSHMRQLRQVQCWAPICRCQGIQATTVLAALQVSRQLALLQALQLPELLGDLDAMTQLAMPLASSSGHPAAARM